MYAIIAAGGKQFTIKEGDKLTINQMEGDVGAKVTFDEVLFYKKDTDIRVGKPTLSNATVTCTILDQKKGPKLIIFKKKRRKGYQKKTGHRSLLTTLMVETISVK